MNSMNKIKQFILISLFAILCVSCGTTNHIIETYNNVTILDDGLGQRLYYPNVYMRSCDVNDSSTVVSFIDKNDHLYIICGKTVVIETVVRQSRAAYYYDYRRSLRPVHPYTYRPTYYNYRYNQTVTHRIHRGPRGRQGVSSHRNYNRR